MKPWRFVFPAVFLVIGAVAAARDWPEDSVIHEKSTSPDGEYGILVPGSDSAADAHNYLAQLKTHGLLGKIQGADYFERQNHRDLYVTWAPDSKTCVVQYDGRFGFDMIALLQLNGSKIGQIDLGKHIEKSLVSVTHDEGQGSAFFRFVPGKLLVRALYYTGNPKMIEPSSKLASFGGTFDLKSKKWTSAEAHKITDWDTLHSAYSSGGDIFVGETSKAPADFIGAIVPNEKEKAKVLDEWMNTVYQGVRLVLPPARFAKVREEQKAWLKKRDATAEGADQCALLEERIKALQTLLW